MVNFIPMNKGLILRWQSDLVNTKECVFPDCDRSYYTNIRKIQKEKLLHFFRNWQWRKAPTGFADHLRAGPGENVVRWDVIVYRNSCRQARGHTTLRLSRPRELEIRQNNYFSTIVTMPDNHLSVPSFTLQVQGLYIQTWKN